jgi:hypothetical protein
MVRLLRMVFGLILVVLSAAVIWTSLSFPHAVSAGKRIPGPGFFPILLGVFLIPGGIHQIISALKTPSDEGGKIAWNWGTANIPILLALLLAYVPLMEWLGYTPATFLFGMLLLLRLKVPFLKALLVAGTTTLFIVFVFGRAFHIQLPPGTIGFPL